MPPDHPEKNLEFHYRSLQPIFQQGPTKVLWKLKVYSKKENFRKKNT
jgi:hypothetical protein